MTAIAVKERPIPFSAEMVRAILDDRKTQTRRVCPQPMFDAKAFRFWQGRWQALVSAVECERVGLPTFDSGDHWHGVEGRNAKCPYGQPGDRLWVREKWRLGDWMHDERVQWFDSESRISEGQQHLHYAADEPEQADACWRPSTHMQRWASRITLEVTDVRVERLQEISDADVRSEGIEQRHIDKYRRFPQFHPDDIHGLAFAETWNQINSKRGYPWDSNP